MRKINNDFQNDIYDWNSSLSEINIMPLSHTAHKLWAILMKIISCFIIAFVYCSIANPVNPQHSMPLIGTLTLVIDHVCNTVCFSLKQYCFFVSTYEVNS